MSCFIIGEFILPPLFSFLPPRLTFLLYFSFLPPLVFFLPIHCPSSHKRRTDRTKKKQYANTFRNFVSNFPVSTILVLPVFSRIFQYLQYLYNQYFLESSSICNTGMTSIFQNLAVSPVFPRIFRYLQYSYLAMTSIF